MNRYVLAIILLVLAAAYPADAGIRIVRAGTNYSSIQAAYDACQAGDTIEVDSGSYADVLSSNNVYEVIREVLRSGYTYSWCQHKWVFNVRAGTSIQFRVEAYRPSNSDSDNFQFAYSTNDSTYTNTVSITKTRDNNTDQTYTMPAGTNGTVYVRVRDTNRIRSRTSLDYIYIDRLVIRSNP